MMLGEVGVLKSQLNTYIDICSEMDSKVTTILNQLYQSGSKNKAEDCPLV